MGFSESPMIYTAALKENLGGLTLPGGSVLLQYVDGLMKCSSSKDACQTDTVALLQHLA